MSEKEKEIIRKLVDAVPKMSDFDKGYLLGRAESIAEEKEQNVTAARKG